jgi:[acyl-carrier-protein] S-malonyltransferase
VTASSAINETTAALFPGQGVSLHGAREPVLELCPSLLERCCEMLDADPFEHASQSTRFAQPAIFLAGVAGWRALQDDAEQAPSALAGHSLGELTALAAAGVFELEDALSLVILRGALMADAAERQGDGGMLAILKGSAFDARELVAAHGVQIANDNAPGQTILSGPRAALDAVAAGAREAGLRAIRLDVAGAFHSPAMQSACAPLYDALGAVPIGPPHVTVYSGMTAAPFGDVRGELARALVQPVRWRETMLALHAAGAQCFLDVGPDKVLARLVARNLPGFEGVALSERHREEAADGVRA